MREKAVVVANRGDKARIEIVRTSACNHCKACSVGTGNKALRVWAGNPLKARVGQKVEVELSSSSLLMATLIAYGIPLAAFLLGIGLGFKSAAFIAEGYVELFSLFVGLCTMTASFLGVHLFSKKEENIKKYTSSIVNILE